jgi:hypothetical protein
LNDHPVTASALNNQITIPNFLLNRFAASVEPSRSRIDGAAEVLTIHQKVGSAVRGGLIQLTPQFVTKMIY